MQKPCKLVFVHNTLVTTWCVFHGNRSNVQDKNARCVPLYPVFFSCHVLCIKCDEKLALRRSLSSSNCKQYAFRSSCWTKLLLTWPRAASRLLSNVHIHSRLCRWLTPEAWSSRSRSSKSPNASHTSCRVSATVSTSMILDDVYVRKQRHTNIACVKRTGHRNDAECTEACRPPKREHSPLRVHCACAWRWASMHACGCWDRTHCVAHVFSVLWQGLREG